MSNGDDFPAEGIWSHAQWADRVNRGLEKTMVFVPAETMPIGINGVTYWVEKDKETELPMPFYWTYLEAMKTRREAIPNAKASLDRRAFGEGTTSIAAGWNGNVVEE